MAFDRHETTAHRPYRRLGTYATALTTLFAVLIVVGIVLTGAHLWRASVFDRRAEGRLIQQVVVSEAEIDAAHAVVVTASVVWWLVAAVTAAVFIMWQFRHAQNAKAFGAVGGLSHPAWAIGAWLIPLGNLILGPRQIYRSRAPGIGRTTLPVRVLTWWAIALALALLVLWLASRAWVDGAQYRFDLIRNSTADYLIAIAALTSAVAASFAIYIVRMFSRRQDEATERWPVGGGSARTSATPQ